MKDSEVLAEVKGLIDTPEKWTKYSWYNSAGQYCIEGALSQVTLGTPWASQRGPMSDLDLRTRIDLFLGGVASELAAGPMTAMGLNDNEATTHDDVMALLDKGIAKLQEEGR